MNPLVRIAFSLALLGALAAQNGAPTPSPAPAPAPAPAPDARLLELLRELRGTDPKAWNARLAELEKQAKALDAEAAKLKQEADQTQQRAAAAAAQAAARRTEVQQLQELQKIVGNLPAGVPPPKTAGDAKPEPKPEAKPEPKTEPKTEPKAEPKVGPKVGPKPDAKPPAVGKDAMPAAAAKSDAIDASALVTWAPVARVFAESCTGCHEPGEAKGGLDLTSFRTARSGGGSGQSIVPGEPDQSRLYRMIAQQERPFMPRNADPLAKEQLALVRTWIEHGAAENADGAKTFLAEKATRAKANAAAEPGAIDESKAPMPANAPALALRTAARPGPIASLARSPAAPLLATPGVRQLVLLGVELQPRAVLPCDLPRLGAVAFSEDGSAVVVAGGEPGKRGVAAVFDVRSGASLGTCGDERDVPLAVAVHRGLGLVALGGAGKHARVHALADGHLAMAGKHDDFVLGLSFSPDGRWLAAGDRAGAVQVWETATGRVFQSLAGHTGAVHAVAFDRTGASVLTAGADGTLRMWDVTAAKERWRQTPHGNSQVLAVAFGPGDAVASCGSDGTIAVFTAGGKPVAKSAAVGEWLYSLGFGSDGNVVFAGDWQGRVHRFDVAKKEIAVSIPFASAQ